MIVEENTDAPRSVIAGISPGHIVGRFVCTITCVAEAMVAVQQDALCYSSMVNVAGISSACSIVIGPKISSW
ncbi:MAG: hypothetical protein RLY87_1660 [Chloroflexota bacterium]|jgi:hypothetical protein